MNTRTFDQDNLIFTVEWQIDYDPSELDFLGTYTSNPKTDTYVDRRYGQIHGPCETVQLCTTDIPNSTRDAERVFESYEYHLVEIIDDIIADGIWCVVADAQPILAFHLPRMSRNEYRYFEPADPSDPTYIEQDYRLANDVNRGRRWFEKCVVTITHKPTDIILVSISRGGYSDHTPRDIRNGAERDLIEEAKDEAVERLSTLNVKSTPSNLA